MSTIHFVNALNVNNCGDYMSSPLDYYDTFSHYPIMMHHVDTVKLDAIKANDIVILGGGGLLNGGVGRNRCINALLDHGTPVIGWSLGFHDYYSHTSISVTVDLNRFALLGIRDYQHPCGAPYLPCVSCMSPELRKTATIKREVGIVEHLTHPISDLPFDRIKNSQSMSDVTDFIASSEIIVTSSYHAAYWAMLMGKPVICTNTFAVKFDYFKYKPEFIDCSDLSIQNIKSTVLKGHIYRDFLDESIGLNNSFLEKALDTISGVSSPASLQLHPGATYIDIIKSIALVNKDITIIHRRLEHLRIKNRARRITQYCIGPFTRLFRKLTVKSIKYKEASK